MISKYDLPADGEWITPVQKGYKLACCDCGLVHDIEFRVIWSLEEPFDSYVQLRIKRNNRATGQRRRYLFPGIQYLLKYTRKGIKESKNLLRIDLNKVHEILAES